MSSLSSSIQKDKAALLTGTAVCSIGTIPLLPAIGGTGNTSLTAHALLLGQGTSAITALSLGLNQVPLGQSSGDPIAANINAAVNPVVNQNTSSVTMAPFTTYEINNGASLVTLTIPTTVALGTWFEIVGQSAGSWIVQASSGQTITLLGVTSAAAGTVAPQTAAGYIKIECTTANTGFTIISCTGIVNIT
jgi:hypothetical protein